MGLQEYCETARRSGETEVKSLRFFRIILPLTAFISGAAVMIFEITASRMIAPYLGASLVTWTSLIGTVLLSLSIGNWLGGRLGDKTQELKILSLMLLGAGLLILVTNGGKSFLLDWVAALPWDVRARTILASLVLLTPVGVLLGMVSPFATRSLLTDVSVGGRTIGGMDALGNIGCIVGTFAAGFILLPNLGTSVVLNTLAAALIALGAVIATSRWLWPAALALLLATGSIPLSLAYRDHVAAAGFIDRDTQYSRIWLYSATWRDGRPVQIFQTDRQLSSARYLDTSEPELVFEYNRLFLESVTHSERALLVGGAGYTFPPAFLAKFPEAHMDVVEIDPGVTLLAQEHFKYRPNERTAVIHADGRDFLNRAPASQYDTVFIDAYSNMFSIPFQLVTEEAFARFAHVLTDDGILAANVISAVEGEQAQLLKAILASLQPSFTHVAIIPTRPDQPQERQNVIIVAGQRPVPGTPVETTAVELRMTDEFAPVDRYTNPLHVH